MTARLAPIAFVVVDLLRRQQGAMFPCEISVQEVRDVCQAAAPDLSCTRLNAVTDMVRRRMRKAA